MIPNNSLSVLPFYDSLDKQNHKKSYVYGEVFPLITPTRRILPFQFVRDTRVNSVVAIFLTDLDGNVIADLYSQMQNEVYVNRYESEGYDVIMYTGLFQLSTTYPDGQYYLNITDLADTYFSEVFTVSSVYSDMLSIEYNSVEDLIFTGGRIDYSNGFKFKAYLCTQLGKPEYVFEEEVENRDGYSFIEKQMSEKVFKFNFLAPEFLCDAMRIIRMSDNITVESLGNSYTVDTFLITPKWEDDGSLAAVDAEFQCDTVIKKIGYVSEGSGTTGAFNNDFNNDFN